MRKHEMDLAYKSLLDVSDAAVEWWAGRRPVGWSTEQHLGNPRVNCSTAREIALAQRVAEWVAVQRGIKK